MNLNKPKQKYEYGGEPNAFLYFMVSRLSKLYLKIKYRIKIDNNSIKSMKAPFIVLGNHPSSLDPFIITSAMYPHKLNFLGTNYYFRNPILRPLFKLGGIVPKIQAYKDTRAVRMMNKVIARGGILAICPEGRRSTDGSQYAISDTIAKLLKLYKVPVVAVVSNGAYLSKPRWSPFTRRGSIEVSVKEVLTAEQLRKLSLEEIHSAVCTALYYNDYEWNKTRKISFRHKHNAENLHFILHKCPSCGNDKAMSAKGSRLYCRFCGNAAVMDDYGHLKPENESSIIFEDAVKWLNWERKASAEQVIADDFSINSKVTKLITADAFTGSWQDAGKGEIFFTKEGLIFKGIVHGQQKEMFFPLSVMTSISSEFGVSFEITDGKETYGFFLEEGQEVIRIELAVKCLTK